MEFDKLMEMDKWILSKFTGLCEKLKDAYDNFLFHRVYHLTLQFVNVYLSALYMDIAKERLYIHGANSYERRSAQTVIYIVARNLIKYLAPILSFTAEDAWKSLPKLDGDKESVHLELFPDHEKELFKDESIEERWDRLLDVRKEVTRALEMARRDGLIGHSFDAQVDIYAEGNLYEFLKDFDPWILREFFIVSKVEIVEGKGGEVEAEEIKGLSVTVKKSSR